MRKVRATGNKSTELRFRASLAGSGIKGWTIQPKMIFSPDFIFENARVAIFIDGCFWHGCPICRKMPSSNQEYWSTKIKKNVERDKKATNELTVKGWTVLRFWEHEIKISLSNCINIVKQNIQSSMIEYGEVDAKRLFYDWLITTEKYSKKSASDMVSRCKRIEKIFNIKLEETIITKENFNKLREKIRTEANTFIMSGSSFTSSISPIVLAIRKYHKFLNLLS